VTGFAWGDNRLVIAEFAAITAFPAIPAIWALPSITAFPALPAIPAIDICPSSRCDLARKLQAGDCLLRFF
jgi:hypothetical protein